MKWKKYIPLAGIILFIYILFKIDIGSIISEIGKANLIFLLMSLYALLLLLITQTFKWFIIARKQEIKIPFSKAFKISLITDFYGFITPSKFGSAVRADYLRKYSKNNLGKGLCNFVLDKIFDLTSLFFLVILFSFILSFKFQDKVSFLPISLSIFLLLGIVIATFIFIDKKRSKALLGFFYRKILPKKLKTQAKLTFESFYDKIPKKRYFILFFIFNLINWIATYLVTFFIAKSLDINLPFVYFLAILPIGTLVTMIPVSINGLGTREATLIKLFGLFGISFTKIFSMSIVSLFISGILPAILASFFIFGKRE